MKYLLPSLLLAVLLVACYPQHKVLFRWPDGNPKIVRYYRHHDSLDEKLVTYYKNGRKQSAKYWKNELLIIYKTVEWYANGKKQSDQYIKYKDTVRHYDTKDSCLVIRGLEKVYYTYWDSTGRIKRKYYNKNGKKMYDQYNDHGICVQSTPEKAIRPDNYDSVVMKFYRSGAVREK
jgi:hypothetical protein